MLSVTPALNYFFCMNELSSLQPGYSLLGLLKKRERAGAWWGNKSQTGMRFFRKNVPNEPQLPQVGCCQGNSSHL